MFSPAGAEVSYSCDLGPTSCLIGTATGAVIEWIYYVGTAKLNTPKVRAEWTRHQVRGIFAGVRQT
jgi:hypothetical protein